jgi:hypothetical protein
VYSVEGMIPMVGLESLEYACGRRGNTRVVQVCAVLDDRKQLTDFVPHGEFL